MIDLSTLKSPVIDFKGLERNVHIVGKWTGPRLIWKNAARKNVLLDCEISSDHHEDAIYFDDDVIEDFTLIGAEGSFICGGGIHLNKPRLKNVTLDALSISYAHSGIRMTQPRSSENVTISNCIIDSIHHEGIYVGPHYKTVEFGRGLKVFGNLITNTGWDAAQFGNQRDAMIFDNVTENNATLKQAGQDYIFTINPNCLLFFWNNVMDDVEKDVQILDSTVFPHEPKGYKPS